MHIAVSVNPREVRGALYIYSCPRSICTHVNWALTEILETPISNALNLSSNYLGITTHNHKHSNSPNSHSPKP